MNRDEAKQWLPILQAYADGKTIQVMGEISGWYDVNVMLPSDRSWDRYRIKPELKLRPWKPEECPVYFMIRNKISAELWVACKQHGYDHARVFGGPNTGDAYGMSELLDRFLLVKEDGTEHPCGVLEAQP